MPQLPPECAGWWQVVGVCPEGQPQPDHLFPLLPFETLSQPENQGLGAWPAGMVCEENCREDRLKALDGGTMVGAGEPLKA